MSRFLLTAEICKHLNHTEVFEADKSYPTYYGCIDCGSKFPITGDTDLWADGIKLRIDPV